LRQILSFCVTLWLLLTLTFVLIRSIPGDPFADEQSLPHEIHEGMRSKYGLDAPWYVQYARYLKAVATWDFGPSLKYPNRTVNQIINEGFPVSAFLGIESLFLALSCGVIIGGISAVYRNQWPEYFLILVTTLGISIPSFIIAALLQYLFAIKLGYLPVARWGSFTQTILPALSLAALPTAFIARMVKSNLRQVLSKDYITAARAKGVSESNILMQHAMKNVLLPLLPYFGQLSANILLGSFVIEKIFGIPGLGRWFVNSVINRDYSVIMGITLFYGVILLSAVSICDTLYRRLDPRLKEQ
jgi:oligopeptide transport system permease protein